MLTEWSKSLDMEHERFFLFGLEIWPQEFYYVTGLLILASLTLFLVTSLAGRVWCGYFCPQTVWTDLYIHVERWIEGDRNARMRLDKAPMSATKAGKKLAKHALWLLIAAATGGAWVFYFGDAPTLFQDIFTGRANTTIYLFVGVLTFTTYALAGTMREQVCTYMCPWPRIQAALIDKDTLQVTYKRDRGEPRGSHKKGASWEGRGDCIDCNACVAACPMGIDIREGAQLECINCALCIDACDETMAKVGRPRSLIGYDTDANMAGRAARERPAIRLVRPRTVLYASLIALIGVMMAVGLSTRATLKVNVLRDRTPPFIRLSDGGVRNAYTVKIENKADSSRVFEIRLEGLDGARLTAVGETVDDGAVVVSAGPDSVRSVRIFATVPKSGLAKAAGDIALAVSEAKGDEMVRARTTFMKAHQ